MEGGFRLKYSQAFTDKIWSDGPAAIRSTETR
jgi:hypothetical protein